MRPPAWLPLTLSLLLMGHGLAPAPARGTDADLNGAWKLVLVTPFVDQEFLLIDFQNHGGKVEAKVKDYLRQIPRSPTVSDVESKGGAVRLGIKLMDFDAKFLGKPTKGGAILGRLLVNEQGIPARLEKTDEARLAPPPRQPPANAQRYIAAREEHDPKARARMLRAIAAKAPGSPTMSLVYLDLLRGAGEAGLSEEEVRATLDEWVDGAKSYGDAYAADIRLQALQTLTGKPAYAGLAFRLAQEADKAIGDDSPLQARADVARALAEAAKLSGKDQVASTARARAEKLEARLDAEYQKKVPPFKPEADGGPKDRKSDRGVLLELFTGAECPPCVAVDVAFDALLSTYKPAELVTLQYHLHIPGPDPLTNADSVARAGYYPEAIGTPSTVFNGKVEAPGGGPMAGSKRKYDQYRSVIDTLLASPSGAKIDLKVERDADTITIRASAEAKGEQNARDGARVGGSKLKLRLALVEEQVRYVGGNALRFHHHVVRGLPGGVEGKPLSDGKAKTELTVKLSDLRKGLDRYLDDYTKEGEGHNFPRSLPPIDLGALSVVAFVQDDGDKSILNAVTARAGKPE